MVKADLQGELLASPGIDVQMNIKDIQWETIRDAFRKNPKALEEQDNEELLVNESGGAGEESLQGTKESALNNLADTYKILNAFLKPSDEEILGFSNDDSELANKALLDNIVALELKLVLQADRDIVREPLASVKEKTKKMSEVGLIKCSMRIQKYQAG